MAIRLVVVCVLLIVIPDATSLARAGPSYEGVTLIQRDGWSYADVSVSLSDDGTSVIILRPDGARRELPASSVAAILDGQGVDITDRVLGTEGGNQTGGLDEFGTPVRPTADDHAVSPEPVPGPQMFDVMLGAGLGYGSPSGAFYEDLDPGLLYFASLRVMVAENQYFKLGYTHLELLDETVAVYDDDQVHLGDVDLNVNAHRYQFLFGVISRHNGANELRVFAEGGLEVVNHVITARSGAFTESDGETRLLLLAELGFFVPFARRGPGLEVGLSLAAKFYEDAVNEGNGVLLAARGGLVVPFGGNE